MEQHKLFGVLFFGKPVMCASPIKKKKPNQAKPVMCASAIKKKKPNQAKKKFKFVIVSIVRISLSVQ